MSEPWNDHARYKCKHCRYYFITLGRGCTKLLGECDCPRCQGVCDCSGPRPEPFNPPRVRR